MRNSAIALLFSVLSWVVLIYFISKVASYVDNGVEKLDKYWKKIIFSVPVVIFIICATGVVGEVVEFIGIVIQAVAEFLALPILYLLGMN